MNGLRCLDVRRLRRGKLRFKSGKSHVVLAWELREALVGAVREPPLQPPRTAQPTRLHAIALGSGAKPLAQGIVACYPANPVL